MAEGFAQLFSPPVYTSSSFTFSTSSAGPGYHVHGEFLAGVSSQQPPGGKGRGWGCWRWAEGSPSSKARQGWPTEGSCLIRLTQEEKKLSAIQTLLHFCLCPQTCKPPAKLLPLKRRCIALLVPVSYCLKHWSKLGIHQCQYLHLDKMNINLLTIYSKENCLQWDLLWFQNCRK